MKIVVFLGPSLGHAEAAAHLDAIYLPPAAQADVISAVLQHQPDVVALIDGMFGQSLAVWHKEILYALDQGIPVYGAASMGALRAIETEPFGAIGFGEVVRMYRTGEIEDDDEVALAHAGAEDGYRALSEPMVNLRKTFAAALAAEVIDRADHDRLIAAAKALFFPERSFARIFTAAGLPAPVGARLDAFVRHAAVDVKRQDAIGLLDHLRSLDRPPRLEPFTFNRSHFLDALRQRDRMVDRSDGPVALATIANHAALHRADFPAINGAALDRALAQILAEQMGTTVSSEEVEAETGRLRHRLGLADAAALAGWQRRNDLTAAAFARLMTECAVRRKLHRWLIARRHLERTTQLVLDELRLRGAYEAVADDASFFDRVMAVHQGDLAAASPIALDLLVRDHVADTALPIDAHHTVWAEEAGFRDGNDLRLDLMRSRLVRQVLVEIAREAAAVLAEPEISPMEPGERDDG